MGTPRANDGLSRGRVILMPYLDRPSFFLNDARLLAERHTVVDSPCRSQGEILRTTALVGRADLVFCWFASVRFLPVVLAARLLGRKVVIVSGGYDVASLPAIGYGNMAQPLTRLLGRLVLRSAHAVAAFSVSGLEEAALHGRVPRAKLRHIPLGYDVERQFPPPLPGPRERLVLSVGYASLNSIHRKGLLTVARLSHLLPDVRFVIAGPAEPAALEHLREASGPNVGFPGRVSDADLRHLYSTAAVYLQPSLHEGFGSAVAEAMLYGCIPVVSRRFSLPEVVGESGLYADPEDLEDIARQVSRVLEGAVTLATAPRERIAQEFPLARRRLELLGLIDAL